MRSRRRTHHSPVAWSGSDEEFQSQSPRPAWDAAWDGVRAERKQVGLPNTYVELVVTYCRGGDCEFVPPLRRGGGGVFFRPRPAGSPRPGTPLYPPFVRG